ncbi:MAG TPA: MASE1 domain-containing protein [Burkholderiales bacterium]|nr:MASE1 domain-containing protein [Burkholderiales bacterium]
MSNSRDGLAISLPDSAVRVLARFRADPSTGRLAFAAAVVASLYYVGAKIGFALTFAPSPISVLWPPNSLLLAALLLVPTRFWWLFIVAALPAHLMAELQSGVPVAMVLGWFVSNCSEALIGAASIRVLIRPPLKLDSFRHACVFILCAVFLAPLLSTFLDVALVKLIGWREADFWALVKLRFFSNALATLIIVPLILAWANSGWKVLRKVSFGRRVEAGVLFLGLLATGFFIFEQESGSATMPALLYAPLPFLLCAAVRLGPLGISTSAAVVAMLAIWGALHGLGPFAANSPEDNARSVQLFLIAVAVPLLLFAAVMEERKKTQRALQISEERALKVFRASPDPMAITRLADGKILDVNDRWESAFGYSRAEAAGRSTAELGIYANEKDRRTYLDLTAREYIRNFEVDLLDRNGEVHHTVLSGDRVEVAGTACLVTVVRDVTLQKRAEREAQEQRLELMHLSRVVMLGELSGSLAHELNQPLTAILSNAQAAQRLLAKDRIDTQELRDILKDIVDEDRRAGEVIRRLRALFKKSGTQFQRLSANELVNEVLALSRGDVLTRNIEVVTNLAPQAVDTYGDRIQLQQVLLNLINNACEAMDVAGSARTLTIKTAPTADGYVTIFVIDSGAGLPAERTARLFTPFFTTKPHGLGLGLSISRSIVTAHGGHLLARNNPQRGATFRVLLPPYAGTGA